MVRRYGPFLFWIIGAIIISASFYAATARLWKATEEATALSLEKNVVSSSMREIAEGNLIKFFATLSKLQREGQIKFAEIRHLGRDEGVVFKTSGIPAPDESIFRDFNCHSRPRYFNTANGGIGLVSILPAKFSDGECDALVLIADMPEDLRSLKNRLISTLTILVVTILAFFSFSTFAWHRHVLHLEIQNRRMQDERDAAIGRVAAQVAHDIRSPLAALEVAASDASQLPEDKRLLIGSAIDRIRDIANSLLDRHRSYAAGSGMNGPQTTSAELPPQLLSSLIEPVASEKRLQLRSDSRIEIELTFDSSSYGIFSAVQPAEFKRLVSNLINNSVEAFGSGRGVLTVSLRARDGRAVMEVRDSGKGIPSDILAKLGQRGETHGKAGGTGLGLFHARTSAEAWGGSLAIESEVGKGTTVTVSLPLASAPADARGELFDAVLIDDDALARATWRMTAERSGKRLRAFATAAEFFQAAGAIDRQTPVYVDSDLGEGVRGEEESRRIHELGFAKIYMATGHPPSAFSGHAHLAGVVGKKPPWD